MMEYSTEPERPRAITRPVRWCGREVRLISHDDGLSYLGPTGEENLLLVVLAASTGGYVARIEDRALGLSWGTREARATPDVALAGLHRQLKRLARAGKIRGG